MSEMKMKLATVGATNLAAPTADLERGYSQESLAEPVWPMRENANGDTVDVGFAMQQAFDPVGFLTRPRGSQDR